MLIMDKRKCYLPQHFDAGNRGCEAITRGTAEILGDTFSQIIAYTRDRETDVAVGLDRQVSLQGYVHHHDMSIRQLLFRVKRKLVSSKEKKILYTYQHVYGDLLSKIEQDAIVLSTGGDMLCYDDNEVIYINDYLCQRGIKTVLWGCSVGEENLSLKKMETLKRFSLIIARESLTAGILKEKLRLDQVQLFPDPAFILQPIECELPKYFERRCIGINLSNFVGKEVGFDSLFGMNIILLLEHLIQRTSYEIVLIPHVFWKGQDDRIVCNAVFDRFKETGRVHVFDSYGSNYCQIRYLISRCSFFIGARTHAMISAYSMCVPALALGYSVKSKGIAKDVGLPDQLVVDYRSIKRKDEILTAFQYLMEHEDEIRKLLKMRIPQYCKRAYGAKTALDQVLKGDI